MSSSSVLPGLSLIPLSGIPTLYTLPTLGSGINCPSNTMFGLKLIYLVIACKCKSGQAASFTAVHCSISVLLLIYPDA